VTDSAETASFEATPTDGDQPPEASSAPEPSEGYSAGGGVAADHPELLVGAAFAGGLAAALILKRLAR
jgi:hypothetical protein